MSTNLPPDLAMFSRMVEGHPPDVRELFHYALVMLLVEDGKASIVERSMIDGREWIYLLTAGKNCSAWSSPMWERTCWRICARWRGRPCKAMERSKQEGAWSEQALKSVFPESQPMRVNWSAFTIRIFLEPSTTGDIIVI